jgi:hypothetical protein
MERSFGYSSVASLSTHQVVQNLEPLPCYNREKHGILTEPCDERSYQAAICPYGRQCTEPATGWILYVNTLRDKQGGALLLKSPWQSLGKSLLFFAAVVVGQRRKKFCIRGHLKRQQLVVLADRGHVLSRSFRFSIQPTFQNTHHCHFN